MSVGTFEEIFCHAWTPERPGTEEELATRQRMAALVGLNPGAQQKMGFKGGSLIVWRMKKSVKKEGNETKFGTFLLLIKRKLLQACLKIK